MDSWIANTEQLRTIFYGQINNEIKFFFGTSLEKKNTAVAMTNNTTCISKYDFKGNDRFIYRLVFPSF